MLALALVLAGFLTSCSNDSSGHTDPTLPAPSTTTTIDVSKVPPTIDVPYVQAVMDTLDKLTGDAVRAFVAQGGPNKEWYETFRAVFEEDVFERLQKEFTDFVLVDKMKSLRSQPGNPVTAVKRIVDSSPTCLVIEVDRTFGPIFTNPLPADTVPGFVQLSPKRPERDPLNTNPTNWAILADVNSREAKIPENPCA